ncbi:MAG: transposase [bacterium]
MSRPLRIQYPGAYYHITCRGNAKRPIFFDYTDRAKFLNFLVESTEIYDVNISAYILMTNHFHLLIQTTRANLSEFMHRFNIIYTGWFNNRHQHCGHLYQGRYCAFLIDAGSYLLEVSRYVHLNNFRKKKTENKDFNKLWNSFCKYQWSSLLGNINRKYSLDFIDYDMILEMVGGRSYYRRFIIEGMKYDLPNPFENLKHGIFLGDDNFVAKVKCESIEDGSVCEQPSYQSLVKKVIESDAIIDIVAVAMGVNKDKIVNRWGDSVARGIASELRYHYCGLKQQNIGELLGGVSYSAISQLRRRLKEKILKDTKTKEYYGKARAEVIGKLSIVKI